MTGAPVAVITGAASGIGAACARLLGDRGWRTAGIDLNDSGCDLSATLDVTDRDGVRGAVDAAAEFGRIDLAVTAAGYYQEGIAAISRAQWDRMIAVILGGTVNVFAAVKGAVLGVVMSLAMEVATTGVRVNAVAPGPTDTPLLAPHSLWREPAYLATLPLGRLVIPDEVAHTVYYLATEGSMYCGEMLSPNAGAVI